MNMHAYIHTNVHYIYISQSFGRHIQIDINSFKIQYPQFPSLVYNLDHPLLPQHSQHPICTPWSKLMYNLVKSTPCFLHVFFLSELPGTPRCVLLSLRAYSRNFNMVYFGNILLPCCMFVSLSLQDFNTCNKKIRSSKDIARDDTPCFLC